MQRRRDKLGAIRNYTYRKINGVKYYVDVDDKVFSIINHNKEVANEDKELIKNNNSAKEFYKKAYKFKQKFEYGHVRQPEEPNLSLLRNLSVDDAVNSEGIKYSEDSENPNPYASLAGKKIFEEWFNNGTFIEDETSNFSVHRKAVIRNSIESNLIVAISNYNKVSSSGASFAMPKLKDEEWEELTTNISMITFLQGLNIGGKIYNGYAYVPNDINEDFVSEDSIYIAVNNDPDQTDPQIKGGIYYRITDATLMNKDLDNAVGLSNTDFERRTLEGICEEKTGRKDQDGKEEIIQHKRNVYFFPRQDLGAYSSIITLNSNSGIDLKNKANYDPTRREYKILQLYYTALGRERYGMRRVTNNEFPSSLSNLKEQLEESN